jgi:hypothetical protein
VGTGFPKRSCSIKILEQKSLQSEAIFALEIPSRTATTMRRITDAKATEWRQTDHRYLDEDAAANTTGPNISV